MSGSTALVLSNRSYPTPAVSSNFARNLFDWETLSSTSTMPTGGSITRSGLAMLYDSTGKLTYAPNNLLTYSEQFNNAAWTKLGATITADATTAPNGTTTADKLVEDSANSNHFTYLNGYSGTNIKLLASVYVKASERTFVNFQISNLVNSGASFIFNLSNASYANSSFGTDYSNIVPSIVSVGNGWYRLSVSASKGSFNTNNAFVVSTAISSTTVVYTGDGTSGLFIWGAQLEAVTYQTTPSTYVATTTAAYYGPRFDYDPATLAAKGLLVEGQLQQLVSWSEDFRNTADAGTTRPWTYSDVTISPNVSATTAPDGTNTSDKLIEAATTAEHFIQQTVTASNGVYTYSIYLKAAERTNAQVVMSDLATGNATVLVNLSAGTITSTTSSGSWSGTTSAILNSGNGWYRVSLTAIKGAGASIGARTYLYTTSSTYAGNGTSGIYIWGAQLEARAFPTSYLPTQGGTSPFATRAAETFSLTGYANRLVEAYYIDEETGANFSGNSALSTGTVTVSPPTFGWVTSLRAYTNAYAGSISSPSWLSFSRSGNATYYDSTGTLTYAPANLLTYSEDFSNGAWVNAAGGATISRSSATSTNPNGASQAISTYTISAVTGANNAFVYEVSGSTARVGESYVGSVWIRGNGGTSGTIFIYVADAGTAPSAGYFASATVSFTGSWQRFSVKQTFTAATGSSVYFAIGCDARAGNTSSAVAIDVWGAQLERVTYQTAPSAYIPTTSAAVYGPRYDYDPSTVPATPRGLLIEESRANIVTYSEQFDNAAWTKTNTSISANSIAAPDGSNNADKLVEGTGSITPYISAAPTVTISTAYVFSTYIKAAGRTSVRLFANSTATCYAWFNLATGTVGTTTGTTATISYVGNGWYRCSITFTPTVTPGYVQILMGNPNETPTYTGDGVSGIYLWGAQLEAGSFATSYIPTVAASVTRAADVAQLTGSALTTAGAATGTAIVQTTRLLDSAAAHMLLGGSKTTPAARYLMYSGGSNTVLSSAVPGTQINSSLPSGGWTTTPVRGAIGWSSAGFCNAVNNSNVTSTTAAQMELASSVYVGSDGATFFLGGWMGSLALYNTRLPDAILRQKSTVNAPY